MFRPFELALYSEGMSGLPGSLKKENIQQVPEVLLPPHYEESPRGDAGYCTLGWAC